MAQLAPLEAALVPVAGWGLKLGAGHLDPARAARAAAMLRPRLAVPIHWGTLRPRWIGPTSWFRDPPHAFSARVAELTSEVHVWVRRGSPWSSRRRPPIPPAVKEPSRESRS